MTILKKMLFSLRFDVKLKIKIFLMKFLGRERDVEITRFSFNFLVLSTIEKEFLVTRNDFPVFNCLQMQNIVKLLKMLLLFSDLITIRV